MKDAKGHGSNKGGSTGVRFNVDPKTGTTSAQRAVAAREMFGSRPNYSNPTPMPYNKNYATAEMGAGHAKVARIAQQHGIQGGPFKVQALNLKLAGQPFQTVKSFRNNTVAEHVAKYMSVDGAHTRLR